MVSMPNRGRIREGLLREDLFTVVHDLFVTDTALYADYVLPATSQIEHLDLSPAWGHLYLALNRPAIAPRGEVGGQHRALPPPGAAPSAGPRTWLFESDESMLRAALASGHPWLEGITFERLWEQGYARLTLSGGLAAVRGTAASRRGRGRRSSIQSRSRSSATILCRGRARSVRAPGSSSSPARPCTTSTPATATWSAIGAAPGELFIEIHPDDARSRGVATGDAVRVWNDRGEVRAVCSISDRVRPGVAWMPFGGLVDASGARRSVNELTPVEPTDWGGGSGFYDAFVEVAPVATEDVLSGSRRAGRFVQHVSELP